MAGKCVLVTGAGGFIGSEMVSILVASGAGRVVLLEVAEQPLFAIANEVRSIPVLGSVTDRALLTSIFDEHRPDLVLHAAALKHVPLMEHNPLAAVATNSLGTWTLAQVAAEHGTRQMILVSTDKAVEPHSIMGASKRIAELVMFAYPGFGTAVRLANVIGSPCSVAPLFAEQIARGGPVTVTHPAARRFFLTLDEVAALLAQSIDAPCSGILIPDAGEPVLIAELARRIIAASRREIPIVFTEPRPGDKLDEALLSSAESCDGDATASLRCVLSPAVAEIDQPMSALASAVAVRDLPLVLRLVRALVPDYEPSAMVSEAAADQNRVVQT